MTDSELENCLSELRSLCEHLEPPPSHWEKIKGRVIDWWLCNDLGDMLVGWAVWIGLIVGVPLLLSICESKKSAEPKSANGDVVAQYTVTYYADGVQEWDEATDDE
jgi:hypothetical protein